MLSHHPFVLIINRLQQANECHINFVTLKFDLAQSCLKSGIYNLIRPRYWRLGHLII